MRAAEKNRNAGEAAKYLGKFINEMNVAEFKFKEALNEAKKEQEDINWELRATERGKSDAKTVLSKKFRR